MRRALFFLLRMKFSPLLIGLGGLTVLCCLLLDLGGRPRKTKAIMTREGTALGLNQAVK
jgi:hypothetical protein